MTLEGIHGQVRLMTYGNSMNQDFRFVDEVIFALRVIDRQRMDHTDKQVCPWHLDLTNKFVRGTLT